MSTTDFAGRGRSRLHRARLNGYLNATSPPRDALLRAHGFWCWRFRLPLVWYERNSQRSRYGSVHVDLFTTAHEFTDRGMAELAAAADRLGIRAQAVVSPSQARWHDVPRQHLEELTRVAFRVAMRLGNYSLCKRTPPRAVAQMMETIRTPQPIRRSA